jgi:DNA (cytosine-5)-methyltransferase 1
MTLTVGSTFTGVGGADLGLEWAGFSIAWQCELDPWKRQVLAAHWPTVPIYDDITTLHDPPPVDLLVGGFPCQDLSVAGKRKGFDGERSALAFEFLRLARAIAPRWILLENVPGLLSSNRGRDFARLVDEVVACGYGVSWRVLNARHFGVAQARRRVFIVARRADAVIDSGAASRLAFRALCESSSGDPTPGWPAREVDARTPPRCPDQTRIIGVHGDADAGPTGTLTRMDGEQSGQDFMGGAGVVSFYSTGGAMAGFAREDDVSPTLKRGTTLDIASPPAVAYKAVANALDRQQGGPDDNSAQGGHLVSSASATVRRLTPIEAERLMGLPDDWTSPEGVTAIDSKRYAACGDAIVTWCAYWIGQRIRMIEEEA